VVRGSEDHDCAWRNEAERLEGDLVRVRDEQKTFRAQLAALQRHVFGKRSEKMPPVSEELRSRRPAQAAGAMAVTPC
jgi:transposase